MKSKCNYCGSDPCNCGGFGSGGDDDDRKPKTQFEKQITDIELVVDTKPRTYIKWKNTEEGRDKTDCYERIEMGSTIIYVNMNNRSSSVINGNSFFNTLEKIYKCASANKV